MFKALDATGNFIRSIVSLAIVSLMGIGGWLGYEKYFANEMAFQKQQQEIESLSKDLEEKKKEVERLDTAMRLLKVDHRVAELHVLDQKTLANGTLRTRFTFVEIDAAGQLLEKPREFEIAGDIVFIDAWVVSFLDEYVERADPLRGTSLCLFRRVFGEHQNPADGFPLDPDGLRPAGYGQGQMSEAQCKIWKEIWDNFWVYANDAKKAKQDGVRAANGKASSAKLMPGKRYKVLFRSTGDLTIQAEGGGPAITTKVL